MNPGILTSGHAPTPMPYGLLGRLTPVPLPDGYYHPEAADWQRRVAVNGGSVSANTMRAVSEFCHTVDRFGIRDRFVRLNLFVGTGLSAALVPLYRGPIPGGQTFGNTTDTNLNFVSADYNETGPDSGLKGNGSNKSLNTGVLANSITPSNAHLAIGLRAPSSNVADCAIGTYDSGNRAWSIYVRNANFFPNAIFTRFPTSTDLFGEGTPTTSLAAGDLIAAWPVFHRNGQPSGTRATTAGDYPSAHAFTVFGLGSATGAAGTSVFQNTASRMNWYSIGLSMPQWQAWLMTAAVQAFNARLLRT